MYESIKLPEDTDDSRLVDDGFFMEVALNRKQIIESYLSRLSFSDQGRANFLAKDFQRDGSPLADTVALIPIAAHQEAGVVGHTLDQYAAQTPKRPFTVLLYPNAPFDSDDTAIQATMAQIAAAQERHPHLDVRTSLPERYADPRIGTIRRNLWSAALLLAHYEGRFDDPSGDVTGINNDIDLVRMTPRYIARIQERRDRVQSSYSRMGIPSSVSRAHSTFIKHAHDPSHPNVAKATFWHDFSYWQVRPRGSFDAGLVLPFSYYAEHGGIERDAQYHEMAPMLTTDLYVIPGTVLETSPRRFAGRLQSHGLDEIWSADSFDANSSYRLDDSVSDITHAQLESLVINSLDRSMDSFFASAVNKYQTSGLASALTSTREENFSELVRMLDRKKHLASAVLDRFVGVPHAAGLAEKRYNTHKIAEKIITNDVF